MKWEVFRDESYYDLWCVRPVGSRDFNDPMSFHFAQEDDALKLKEIMERAYLSERQYD